jgi:hypothetical protein
MNSDAEAIAITLAGIRTHAVYAQIGLFSALIEKGVVDAERVFQLNQLSAAVLRQAALTEQNKIAAQAETMAADMLLEFERVMRGMATRPPGAGTA